MWSLNIAEDDYYILENRRNFLEAVLFELKHESYKIREKRAVTKVLKQEKLGVFEDLRLGQYGWYFVSKKE